MNIKISIWNGIKDTFDAILMLVVFVVIVALIGFLVAPHEMYHLITQH
jgi:hypothetical protein